MASSSPIIRPAGDYTVAIICPMGIELAPVKALLDHVHSDMPILQSKNSYVLGDMVGHHVVIAVLPETGTSAAAKVAVQLMNDFPAIRFGLIVGIGGGVPDDEHEDDGIDIRLGDVVVSKPTGRFGGVVQYDLGKHTANHGFEHTGSLNKPPDLLRSKVEQLAADHRIQGSKVQQFLSAMLEKYPAMKDDYSCPSLESDLLFCADYLHVSGRACRNCDKKRLVERDARRSSQPKIHYGTIGSANAVVKDGVLREKLRRDMSILCVEMEAAGLMDDFPCLAIRGICDYADSHKNKRWQPYAAATAAAYAKELLSIIPPIDAASLTSAASVVGKPNYDRGLNFFEAPDIDHHQFVGREKDMERIRESLLPGQASIDRKVLVLGGMGGIGKTQLAISYAKKYRHHYSSIFWLNATSEATLVSSLRLVATRILPTNPSNAIGISNEQVKANVLNWLSELDNGRWLLIFDNYDEPDTFSISMYYPYVSQGSIIITSRLPDHVHGRPVHMAVKSCSIEDGLKILSRRSEREHVGEDIHARQLAEKLAGLPLALATAGAFLHKDKSMWSFEDYLASYERQWSIDPRHPPRLSEYGNRTLFTTWDISYARLKNHKPTAAKFLKLLAYFDNQNLWYDLFCAERRSCNMPRWLSDTIANPSSFESVIRVLVEHCFVEVQLEQKTYSLHNCVHDWTVARLNRPPDSYSYWYAFDCISSSISITLDDWASLTHAQYARLTPHAVRLVHDGFGKVARRLSRQRLNKADYIAELLHAQSRLEAAVIMTKRLLAGLERIMGPEHISSLQAVSHFGLLYIHQGRIHEAEKMYQRALTGMLKTVGQEREPTLRVLSGLASVYKIQGRLDESEILYRQVVAGAEKLYGLEHRFTLNNLDYLGSCYAWRGKFDQAEEILVRALAGREKVHGLKHTSTLDTVFNLASLHCEQGQLEKAERMCQRVLLKRQELLGIGSGLTTDTFNLIANIYLKQGKLDQAEQILGEVLVQRERLYGPDHYLTLETVNSLANVHDNRGEFDKAAQMYRRALSGCEKTSLCASLISLVVMRNLGFTCAIQGKSDEARDLLEKSLAGSITALGLGHGDTLEAALLLDRLAYLDKRERDQENSPTEEDRIDIMRHGIFSTTCLSDESAET